MHKSKNRSPYRAARGRKRSRSRSAAERSTRVSNKAVQLALLLRREAQSERGPVSHFELMGPSRPHTMGPSRPSTIIGLYCLTSGPEYTVPTSMSPENPTVPQGRIVATFYPEVSMERIQKPDPFTQTYTDILIT